MIIDLALNEKGLGKHLQILLSLQRNILNYIVRIQEGYSSTCRTMCSTSIAAALWERAVYFAVIVQPLSSDNFPMDFKFQVYVRYNVHTSNLRDLSELKKDVKSSRFLLRSYVCHVVNNIPNTMRYRLKCWAC